MINKIKLRKGLDINLTGVAVPVVKPLEVKGTYAICPDDFYGFKPKVLVHEGDSVQIGDPLFASKLNPEVQVVAPVSGTVSAIVRGDRRKVLRICIDADGKQTAKTFNNIKDLNQLSSDEVKQILLETGLFAFIKQRPYDIAAIPTEAPKAIFISAFSKMPLAADFKVVANGRDEDFKRGLLALSKMAPVHLGVSPEQVSEPWAQTEAATVTVYDGPNPSGNVGVQINHTSPINKGEVVWTVAAADVLMIGELFRTRQVNMERTIAVAGSEVKEPCYRKAVIGAPMSALLAEGVCAGKSLRIINGNPLVGVKATMDGYLAANVSEVCVIPEGDDVNEVLGWIMPRLNDYSTSRSYLSWLLGKKAYTLDARIKGGERHIIMSGEYDRVLPMDIYGGYLIKAIITGDIDRMEQLGIYEVAPEDFAVAEFVDSSKLELQRIVREGLDMLRKEMS